MSKEWAWSSGDLSLAGMDFVATSTLMEKYCRVGWLKQGGRRVRWPTRKARLRPFLQCGGHTLLISSMNATTLSTADHLCCHCPERAAGAIIPQHCALPLTKGAMRREAAGEHGAWRVPQALRGDVQDMALKEARDHQLRAELVPMNETLAHTCRFLVGLSDISPFVLFRGVTCAQATHQKDDAEERQACKQHIKRMMLRKGTHAGTASK
eukprot:1158270-Pelagomonas_calceolata.AAC.5